MAVGRPPRATPLKDGRYAVTFRGETAFYTTRELEILATLEPTDENSNAAEFIHLCKARLDATLAE